MARRRVDSPIFASSIIAINARIAAGACCLARVSAIRTSSVFFGRPPGFGEGAPRCQGLPSVRAGDSTWATIEGSVFSMPRKVAPFLKSRHRCSRPIAPTSGAMNVF